MYKNNMDAYFSLRNLKHCWIFLTSRHFFFFWGWGTWKSLQECRITSCLAVPPFRSKVWFVSFTISQVYLRYQIRKVNNTASWGRWPCACLHLTSQIVRFYYKCRVCLESYLLQFFAFIRRTTGPRLCWSCLYLTGISTSTHNACA
jgi:hypothetical protein